VTAQPGGNASVATSEMFSGNTTRSRDVLAKAVVSIRVNSESFSKEIDKRDPQPNKILNKRFEHDKEF
jgi:flagellar basal body-associated protein FliL